MASPDKQMVPPAMAWVYRSNLPNLAKPMPQVASKTMDTIVTKVVTVKIPATRYIPIMLLFAAGHKQRD